MKKTYSELITLNSYDERLKYLALHDNNPGNQNRALMNEFYKGDYWTHVVRPSILKRDLGYDLGINGLDIEGSILVHHINPITEEDVLNDSPLLYDPENLISVSYDTHGKIHYVKEMEEPYVERKPGDTKLW